MAIRKPIFVVPHDLGDIVCGSAQGGNPVFNLNEFLAPGLTWRTDGDGALWARGEFDTAQWIDFCAVLSANASGGTTLRIRLGGSQAEVDGTPTTVSIDSSGIANAATYTADSSHASYAGAPALATNGAGLRDGLMIDSPLSAHATAASIGDHMTIDLGALAYVETVEVSPIPSFGTTFLNGANLKASVDGSIWISITAISGTEIGAITSIPVAGLYRYIRLTATAPGLAVSEFRVKCASGYDSAAQKFINPVIAREDGLYHSHLEMPSQARAKWWRIDIGSHSGDFEAGALVLGKQIVPSRYYNVDYERGIEDLGEMNFGRWIVPDESPGAIMRTLGFTLAWQTEAEFEANFRPMMEKVGKRRPVYCCFDPEATAYRQAKTYLGVMRKPPFARGIPKPLTVSQEFDIVSVI